VQPIQEEYENYIGYKIPEEIKIHPPNNVQGKRESRGLKNYRRLAKYLM
jgi:hypothetical protein